MRRSNEGFILITVLLVIAVLFPLILAFNAKVQLNLIRAENFKNSVQASRMARSGVEGAIGILKQDDPGYDTKRDKWATAPKPGRRDRRAPRDDHRRRLEDTGQQARDGRHDRHGPDDRRREQAATGKTVTDQVDQDLNTRLRALVTRLGGRPEVVDALIDWLDADDKVTGSEGAEDEYYKQKGYRCKNGPLDSLEELSLVKGFDKDLLIDKDLKSYLTVAPTDGKVNVNTASLTVLYVVLETQTTSLPQPLSEGDVQNLALYRDEHDLKAVSNVTAAVKISQTQASNIAPLIKVNSAYFTVHSRYTIGRVVKNVEALLKRDSSTVATISWREY